MSIYAVPRGVLVLLTLVWLALLAFLLAHLTSLFVAEATGARVSSMSRVVPAPSISTSLSTRELGTLILESSIFPGDSHLSAFSGGISAKSQDSSLPVHVELVGTVAGSGAFQYAILQSPQSQTQTLYRLGDSIPLVGTLVQIHRHRVVIKLQDGRHTTLEAEWLKRVATPSSPNQPEQKSRDVQAVVPRREIVEAFSNLPHLLQQAKATPVISGNGMNGVSFEVIQSASIFERLGFQVGDELKAINGVPLQDPGTLLTALRQIQHESAVALDVVRNNENITMRYDIR